MEYSGKVDTDWERKQLKDPDNQTQDQEHKQYLQAYNWQNHEYMDNISEQTTGRSTGKSKEGQEEITEIRYRTLHRKQNLLQLVKKNKNKMAIRSLEHSLRKKTATQRTLFQTRRSKLDIEKKEEIRHWSMPKVPIPSENESQETTLSTLISLSSDFFF